MLGRHPNPKDAGAYAKPKRWLELDGLAIDAGGDGLRGVDLEARGRPLPPTVAATPVAGGRHHRDAEHGLVEARPGAAADGVAEAVAVVGDQDHRARLVRATVRVGLRFRMGFRAVRNPSL